MSDLAKLLDDMRVVADDAASLGEFRLPDGTANYPAILKFMRSALHIHGGDEPGAGIAVFPLSYCALTMLTPEERDRAAELSWPLEEQRAWARARQEEFERRFPEARRQYARDEPADPDATRGGSEPAPGIVSRIFRRRVLRR